MIKKAYSWLSNIVPAFFAGFCAAGLKLVVPFLPHQMALRAHWSMKNIYCLFQRKNTLFHYLWILHFFHRDAPKSACTVMNHKMNQLVI